ncbi:hypothetical protein [Candidatus Albibeggiatoa sp. nov. BB20]
MTTTVCDASEPSQATITLINAPIGTKLTGDEIAKQFPLMGA